MYQRTITIFTLLLALIMTVSLPATPLQATPAQQDDAPTLATAAATVELSNQFGRAIVSARGNHFVVNSAPPLGHPPEEINPVEAMLGALATCGLFVYESAAAEMAIPLAAAMVTVQGDFDARGLMGTADVDPRVQAIRMHFTLEGPDGDQAAQLAEQFTTRCPIYTTLIKAAPIEITHNAETMSGPSAEGLATGTVTAVLSNQPGRAILNVRNDYLVVDSVPPLGGPNLSVNPMDLLLAAQGTCGTFIMEKAAIDQAILFDGASGTVEVDFNPQGLADGSVDPAIQPMRIVWEVATDRPEDADLLVDEWLRRCPIYNTLIRAMDISVSRAGETVTTHQYAGYVVTHPETGAMAPVEGATAHIVRSAEGVTVQMHTMNLEPGNVYTAWWVLANNPDVCEASPCSGADFVGKAADAQTEVAYADGVIVGESGEAHFAAYLPVGEVTDDPWFGNGFTNPAGAEIHLVINSHGPLIPERAGEMLNTYRAGCTDESLPAPFPATAKADGEAGPNTCALVQAAVFQPEME